MSRLLQSLVYAYGTFTTAQWCTNLPVDSWGDHLRTFHDGEESKNKAVQALRTAHMPEALIPLVKKPEQPEPLPLNYAQDKGVYTAIPDEPLKEKIKKFVEFRRDHCPQMGLHTFILEAQRLQGKLNVQLDPKPVQATLDEIGVTYADFQSLCPPLEKTSLFDEMAKSIQLGEFPYPIATERAKVIQQLREKGITTLSDLAMAGIVSSIKDDPKEVTERLRKFLNGEILEPLIPTDYPSIKQKQKLFNAVLQSSFIAASLALQFKYQGKIALLTGLFILQGRISSSPVQQLPMPSHQPTLRQRCDELARRAFSTLLGLDHTTATGAGCALGLAQYQASSISYLLGL